MTWQLNVALVAVGITILANFLRKMPIWVQIPVMAISGIAWAVAGFSLCNLLIE